MDMSIILVRGVLWTAILVLLFASARTDLADRIIPNRFVILIATAALLLSVMIRPDLTLLNLLFALIVFLLLGTLVHYGFLGGGDAKLITVVTLFVPPSHISKLLITISLAGGLLSVAYLAAYWDLPAKFAWRRSGGTRAVPGSKSARLHRQNRAGAPALQTVPYAVAVLAGTCIYLASELYKCFYATSCSL
jgi:prepilin peptidase CpaA